MSITGALKNFLHLYSAVIWSTPLSLCTLSLSAAAVDLALLKAVCFWPPCDERRTDSQADGRSSFPEQDRQTAVCLFTGKL